jgi:iron complex transport system substrate-binding protein
MNRLHGKRWLLPALLAAALGCGRQASPDPAAAGSSPRRIASLTLATDELLAELVPVERIACVTYLADDPQISNVPGVYPPRIPRFRDTDPERIIALNPDLVCVAAYNSADFLQMLERSGLPVHRNEAYRSMDQIEAGILDLGRRVGEPTRAREMADRLRARRQALAERLRGIARRPGVLHWSAGFTSGRDTTIDDIVREAGGVTLAAERTIRGPAEIAPEQVIAIDPDIVLQARWSADERDNGIEHHPLLRHLRAVRENRVIVIDGRYLTAVSQHVVEGAERLARQLHPDCFPMAPAPPANAPPARLP